MLIHFYALIMNSSSEKFTVTVKDDDDKIVTVSHMSAEEIIEAEKSFL